MPNYAVYCNNCDYVGEIWASIHNGPPKKCLECQQDTLEQDYSQNVGIMAKTIAADSEPDKIPLGIWAERNTAKRGKEFAERQAAKDEDESKRIDELNESLPNGRKLVNTKKLKKPFFRKDDKPLEIKRKDGKILDTKKYVRDGIKIYKSK